MTCFLSSNIAGLVICEQLTMIATEAAASLTKIHPKSLDFTVLKLDGSME